jgi:hypothetical protein
MGIILVSFNLFDHCLPQVSIKSRMGWMSAAGVPASGDVRPGAAITMISMSVSVVEHPGAVEQPGFRATENVIRISWGQYHDFRGYAAGSGAAE